jgi:hypothetical protein
MIMTKDELIKVVTVLQNELEAVVSGTHEITSLTIKPKQTWVGLTDEERSRIWGELPQTLNPERDACVFAETIEVYLKEKNT